MAPKQKLELIRKVEVIGINDLTKIAPIGNLGYMNGWKIGGIEFAIVRAFREQMKTKGFKLEERTRYRCDREYTCHELNLSWSVDSSD